MTIGEVSVSDGDLLTSAAGGDMSAFGDLFDRHAETVARYLWAWFEHRGEVQDLVQDTFVTAWEKSGSVRLVDSSALPWLLTTARNHAHNRRRTIARRRETDIGPWEQRLTDESGSDERERLRWVLNEIEALPELDRRICELCLVLGFSYAEAAAEVGVGVSALAKRLQRAKERIRRGDDR